MEKAVDDNAIVLNNLLRLVSHVIGDKTKNHCERS